MRFQIEVSKDEARAWDELIEEATGVKSKKDLINNALTLLEWAFKEREAGRTIVSLDEKEMKYKELVMPIFPSIKSKKKRAAKGQAAEAVAI